jgi:Asp-tRNA(Asn)/Glu-tRNA(Gln) amidotransferase A subunit family amidase
MKISLNKRELIVAAVAAAFLFGAFTGSALLDAITGTDVKSAAKIAGVEYSQKEVDSIVSGLEDYRKSYLANREKELPNSLPPAFQFQPLPPGYVMDMKQESGGFTGMGNIRVPNNRDDLAYYSVQQLSKLISTKQITSEELTKFFIERLKKYNPKINCVVTLNEENALAQARAADKALASGEYYGMLHGIPYGIKDMFATKGLPTTYGAAPYKNQMLDYDATVVEKLQKAGAVLVAKLSLGELAMGDTWFGGQTRNPWDTATGSSGSSAGPASAVAAGLVPFAIGSETLGSIVSPSTVCGTTGLRPTFGRVSRHGAMALSWTMDKIGPICRSAEECAIVFSYIHGPDGKDRTAVSNVPFSYPSGFNPKLVRIGYIKSAFDKDYPFKQQDSMTLKVLSRMGFELKAIELPALPKIDFIVSVEAAAAFDELTLNNQDDQLAQQLKRSWPIIFRTARMVPAVEYIKANRIRTQLIADVDKVFKDVDIIVHPSWASDGLRISNYTGHPAVVVPNGLKENKPTSITFMGGLYKEGVLLKVSQSYQDEAGFQTQRPKLD